MRNALKMAAWISCACLLLVLAAARPVAAQQQTTPEQQTATQQATQAAPAPAPVPAPPVPVIAPPFYAGDGFSITLQYEYLTGHPFMGTGRTNGNGEPSAIDYAGKARPSPAAIVSIPVGKHHAVRVSYFRIQGSGNPTASQPLIIFGTSYNQGDYLATNYNLQNVKLSLDYLSWPFPIKDSKFHIKTLWEVQYTNIGTNVDAPLRHGQTDASGAPILTTAYGKDWFVYPSFGLGIDYLISGKLRFEARASGFAFPHRSTIWDTEASLNYRFGKLELQAGVKAFHFKTSPQRVEYVHGTFPGAYVGLRFYPEFGKH
jgi:hypothetical protein